MNAFSSAPAIIRYTRGLVELHELMVAGKGDSPAADALRDEMDTPFYELSSEQVEWVAGLSEDLYTLEEDDKMPHLNDPIDPKSIFSQFIALSEAHQAGDWTSELKSLRYLSEHFPPAMAAYLRSCAYFRLGQKEVGMLFLDRAVQLAPENVNFQALALRRRADLSGSGSVMKTARDHLRTSETPGPLVIAAAEVAFSSLHPSGSEDSPSMLLDIVNALKRLLPRGAGAVGGLQSVLAEGYAILGFCYARLGEVDEALAAFNTGLKADPENSGLLTARGLTLMTKHSELATADFSKAAGLSLVH